MKPWENRIILKDGRYEFHRTVDEKTYEVIDVTEDVKGWIERSKEPVTPCAKVMRHTGQFKDMAIITWLGEQPAEGTILYTKPTA
jgi:hypothetical protein